MSMLAGPRRKQKVINLRAKNSAWSNDSNKFGQRMLEKMGWSSGKGLGAKENGIVEHVVARYKNDEKGLGFEDKNDQWTKHEDDFNALLANLSNGDSNEEKLHSGVSLEAKSKTSKTRVHYHKFTRGKDLTRYSEKDLANIFGKKTLKNVVKPEKEDAFTEEINTTEQIFTEKGSMEDYFKNKFLARKTKVSFDMLQNDEDEPNFAFQGFAGTQDDTENPCDTGFQGFSFCNKNSEESNESVKESKPEKKKKKSKSNKGDEENELLSDNHIVEKSESFVTIKKKSKNKLKIKSDELPFVEELEINKNSENVNEVPENEEVPVKKKKSKKKKIIEEESNDQINEILLEDGFVPKKKKKRKNKDHA